VGNALANDVGITTLLRTVGRVACPSLVPTTRETRRGVRGDALLAHEAREVLTSIVQHFLFDVRSAAVFAFGFHDHMNVGILLIGVQHHRIPVPGAKLLARKLPGGAPC
jgi:hypothetical protein